MADPVPRWLCALDRALSVPEIVLRRLGVTWLAVEGLVVMAFWYGMLVGLPAAFCWFLLLDLALFVPGLPVPFIRPALVVAALDGGDALLALMGTGATGFCAYAVVAFTLEDRYPDWRDRCRRHREEQT